MIKDPLVRALANQLQIDIMKGQQCVMMKNSNQ